MSNSESVSSLLALMSSKDFNSILFKIAIYYAEFGKRVWFISPETFNKTPANIKHPEKEVLQLITFIYLKQDKDLLSHLNGIHLWRNPPSVIILAGFEHYCNLAVENGTNISCINASCFLTTTLLDSARFCASKNNTQTFLLIASSYEDQVEDDSRAKFYQTIIDLYLDCVIDRKCFDSGNDTFYEYIINFFK